MDLDRFARLVVDDRRNTERRHQERGADRNDPLPEAGERAGNRRNEVAFLRVACERGHHRPVGNIGERVRHAPEDVGHGDIDRDGNAGKMERIREQKDQHDRVERRACQNPRTVFTHLRVGVVHDGTHHRVVDAVPDPGDRREHQQKRGFHAEHVGQILREERVKHSVAQICRGREDEEEKLYCRECWKEDYEMKKEKNGRDRETL